MKERFEEVVIEVIYFDAEDIITTSNYGNDNIGEWT